MNRVKIRLDTFSDVQDFVIRATELDTEVYLTDGNKFCVSGKSLLGALCTIEWGEIYCETSKPIDFILMDYIVGD